MEITFVMFFLTEETCFNVKCLAHPERFLIKLICVMFPPFQRFGMLFSPMIPLMTVLKLFIVFYVKKVSLLYNFTPSTKPYRASDSHFFVQIVLLGAYVVCITPIMYIIWRMSPSTGCGPFRSYDYMYETMSATIDDWPRGIRYITDFFVSTAFGIPAFIVLV
ncbi:Transmembrane channel-like protein 7 [Lamellibrachia satsuma]|nr:Transmembrane channel-like protein 7 [Lamellibrachia satsuma]